MEKFFLAGVLNNGMLHDGTPEKLGFLVVDNPGPETVVISFERRRTDWKNEGAAFSQNFLFLSRICMVFPVEPWEEKNLSLEEITNGVISYTDLIPLHDLTPPHTALKIEGYDVSDAQYPLVYESGLSFSYGGKHKRRIAKKITALAYQIQQMIKNDLFENNEEKIEFDKRALRIEQRPVLFRIAAGGDVMLARGAEDILFDEGPEGILGGTAALVQGADLSLINLEGSISSRGEKAEKTYTFRFDPRAAPALKNSGFDAMLIANNHAFDFGMTGFYDTLDHLDQAGLGVLGAGRNIHAAAAPFYKNGSNLPVKVFGIASYGRERSGWDGLDFAADEQMPGILHAGRRGSELIKQQMDKGALNIVFFHGGIEYADYPDNATRSLYTDLIRSGADLVIGTHPHVEQGFEWVEGKPVFWSLGDYVFNEMDDTPGGDMGIFIVLSYLDRILVHIDIYPVFMDGPRTVISPPEQLDRFYRLTRTLAQK